MLLRTATLLDVTIVTIYRALKVQVRQLRVLIMETLQQCFTPFNNYIGYFNINWLNEAETTPLYNLFVRDLNYRQLEQSSTTDYRATIDRIYTMQFSRAPMTIDILQTFFTDHA